MFDKNKVNFEILQELNKSNIFSADEIKWCATILNRPEPQQVGQEQLLPLAVAVTEYNNKTPTSAFADYQDQLRIKHILFSLQSFYYRQRRILVCCPSRNAIVPAHEPPANLGGLIIPQHIRAECDSVYGLSYEDSRTYFIDKAFNSGVYSDLLFVDRRCTFTA